MNDIIVFFVVILLFAYASVAVLSLLRSSERKLINYLKGMNSKIEAVITVIKILGIPLIMSMLIALPELVIPLSAKYDSCKVCAAETKTLLPTTTLSPDSCNLCSQVDLNDTPPGYMFVVAMIIIFITLELAQLDAIKSDVRQAWSGLLLFCLVLDLLSSAVLVLVKYDQYNNMEYVYLIGLLAFLASFLVIVLSRIDRQQVVSTVESK